jgi:hypothetical protein
MGDDLTMRAILTYSLLIPALLVCPLFCGTGIGGSSADCCAASQQPTQGCADCHAQEAENPCQSEPAAPHKHQPGPQTCQCICGGAVLADGVQIDHPFAGLPLWIADGGDIANSSAVTLDCSPDAQFFSLQRDVGATPGRLLRCLYSSFLC